MKKSLFTALVAGAILTGTEELGAPDIPNTADNNFNPTVSLERAVTQPNPVFKITEALRPTTKSQAAVDSMIKEDLEHFQRTGKGLYLGRPISSEENVRLVKNIIRDHKVIDCYDAWKIVLDAELPNRRKEIFRNSRDQNGNFSAPFAVHYLSQKEQWDVFGYYADEVYKDFGKKKQIIEEDLVIGFDKADKPFYRTGAVRIKLKEIFPLNQADSLLKQLTLERGYGLGFQRDGNHCYALVQKGLFEVHSDAFPLGYQNGKTNLHPIDLHKERYHARSSVAIFAFPKR